MADEKNPAQAPKTEAPKKESAGEKPHVVQNAVEQNPGDVAAQAIDAAEAARKQREEQDRAELAKTLPQSTLDEMEAGKAALNRKQVAAPQATADKA